MIHNRNVPRLYRNSVPQYSMGGVLSGAAAGATAGSLAGPFGTVAGAVGGAIYGLWQGSKEEKAAEEQQSARLRSFMTEKNLLSKNNDRAVLSQFNEFGNPNVSYFAKGGTIDLVEGRDYEVEGDEVVQGNATLESSTQIASDMNVAQGPSHQGGGVGGVGGERVFSDRLKVDVSLKELLGELGIGKVSGKTYAQVAENIGKKKGKLENKLLSVNVPSQNTANKTLPRVDAALDILFEGQESLKENNSASEPYRRIDAVGKFPDGGIIPPYLDSNSNPFQYSSNFPLTALSTKKQIEPLANNGGIFNPSILDFPERNLVGTGSDPLRIKSPEVAKAPKKVGSNFAASDVIGHVGNLGAYISNLEDINNIDTSVRPQLIQNPNYLYEDRSGVERREVGRAVRTGQEALGTSSRTVNAANQGAIIAQGFNANNQITQQESRNRDRYNQRYDEQVWRTAAANTQMTNEADERRRELGNNQIKMKQQARSAFMQGVAGNEAVRQQRNMDRNRLKISALLNNNNEVLDRAAEKLGYTDIKDLLEGILRGR